MNCDHQLDDDPTGLVCIRSDEHRGGRGCVYEAAGGPDGHTTSEDAAERSRG